MLNRMGWMGASAPPLERGMGCDIDGGRLNGTVCGKGCERQFAIMVVRALQIDHHAALRPIVTDALDDTTAWRVATFKLFRSPVPRYLTSTVLERTSAVIKTAISAAASRAIMIASRSGVSAAANRRDECRPALCRV
jgi:hypothetical protein